MESHQLDINHSAENPKANPCPWHSTRVTNPAQRPDKAWPQQSEAGTGQDAPETALLKQQEIVRAHSSFHIVSWSAPENHTWETTQVRSKDLRLLRISSRVP